VASLDTSLDRLPIALRRKIPPTPGTFTRGTPFKPRESRQKRIMIPYTKLEGAGNRLVIVESTPKNSAHWAHLARTVCSRDVADSDGLIVFSCRYPEKKTQAEQEWSWNFFNSDGSGASHCGNGSRCAVIWFQEKFPTEANFQWRGPVGLIQGRLRKSDVPEVTWPIEEKILALPKDLELEIRSLTPATEGFWVNSGVPHLVLFRSDHWSPEDRQQLGPHFRSHPSFGGDGTNVTFVDLKTCHSVTFERGVEGETLSCGSGAIAAFLALENRISEGRFQLEAMQTFEFPGGSLSVLRRDEQIWLNGLARIFAKGTVTNDVPHDVSGH
jgi:diaminopimelate epimerase